jgi:MFS transporter, DHA2 family, multidrug resistance protein
VGSVFRVAVPAMALLLLLGPALLPEYRSPEAGRIELWSGVLSLGAVLAAIYGLKQIAGDGVEGLSMLSIAAGFLLGGAFVRRQRALREPMPDLDLFRIRAFSAPLAAYGISIGVSWGAYVFILQYPARGRLLAA